MIFILTLIAKFPNTMKLVRISDESKEKKQYKNTSGGCRDGNKSEQNLTMKKVQM